MMANYSHYFDLPHTMCVHDTRVRFQPEIQKWLHDTCQGIWFVTAVGVRDGRTLYRVVFMREEDAVLFKLFWLDN